MSGKVTIYPGAVERLTARQFWAYDYVSGDAKLVDAHSPQVDQPDRPGFISYWVPSCGRRMIVGLTLFTPDEAGQAAALAHRVSTLMQRCCDCDGQLAASVRELFRVAGVGWTMLDPTLTGADGVTHKSLPVCVKCRAVIMPEYQQGCWRDGRGQPLLHPWCNNASEQDAQGRVGLARHLEFDTPDPAE